jgi:N-acetylglucosamine-6-phosphate deacetylase
VIRNVRALNPGVGIAGGDVLVRDGRILAVGDVSDAALADVPGATATVIDGIGRLLTPGLIDLHTHGIGHSLYESGPDGLRAAARELGRFGVTTVLPTIVPQIRDGWIERLGEIAAAIPSVRGVHIPGLHIEGPFMAVGGAACPTLPGDIALLDRILAACDDHIAVMSVSPDTPNIVSVIRRLREKNITVFLTHTRADVEQTEAALAAGATHATHFYDVFYPPDETDPGVRPVGAVEAILADPRVTVDFIADGVHVHPTAIRAAVAAKTWAGVTLITDSNIGAGMPPGVYETPWGYRIQVSAETAARHVEKKFLAGSALTMDRGMANLLRWLTLPPEQTWAMGTLNPARVIGLARKGRLEAGADADLVLWDADLRPAQTWLAGESTYSRTPVTPA